MTDAKLTQAIVELQEVVRCHCDEAFRDRGLQDPQCQCDSAEAVKVVANRIKDLTAKLAKAVEALEDIVKDCEADYPPSHVAIKYFAIGALAEIKGESQDGQHRKP